MKKSLGVCCFFSMCSFVGLVILALSLILGVRDGFKTNDITLIGATSLFVLVNLFLVIYTYIIFRKIQKEKNHEETMLLNNIRQIEEDEYIDMGANMEVSLYGDEFHNLNNIL